MALPSSSSSLTTHTDCSTSSSMYCWLYGQTAIFARERRQHKRADAIYLRELIYGTGIRTHEAQQGPEGQFANWFKKSFNFAKVANSCAMPHSLYCRLQVDTRKIQIIGKVIEIVNKFCKKSCCEERCNMSFSMVTHLNARFEMSFLLQFCRRRGRRRGNGLGVQGGTRRERE